MRHEKAEILLKIAMDMQGQRQGLSLQDIAARYSDAPLSRRTSERLRDAIERLFPGRVEEISGDNNTKRWRLRTPWLRGLSGIEADTLGSLDTASRVLEQAGLHTHVDKLAALRSTLVSLLEADTQARLDDDVSAASGTEIIAIRPGPRVKFSSEVLSTLREALKTRKMIRVAYRYRRTQILRHYDLHPCGLLYGHRHYLVASRAPGGPPRYFILGRIEEIEILPFAAIPPKDFSLTQHVERSFGLWQEDPVDVHWRFKPEVAEEASEFVFHPTQRTELAEDGSLHVRFRAGGLIEMDWHLYTWGDGVEILSPSPKEWRARLQESRNRAAGPLSP